MKGRWPTLVALALLVAGAAMVFLALHQLWGGTLPLAPAPTPSPSASPGPSPTPAPTLTEPILPPPPTATASPLPSRPVASSTAEPPSLSGTPLLPSATEALPSATATKSPSPTVASPLPLDQGLLAPRQRLGAGSGNVPLGRDLAAQLGLGWYLDWTVRQEAFRSPEVTYMPMIRLSGGTIQPDGEELRAAARSMPGALWLIGNEPDVKWQDNVTPGTYAAAYHHLYFLLKDEDPSCRVAIGGVSQPTPLRLRYLERILSAYAEAYGQPMPVDVWNVHNFILREEWGSWGVDIPPGMADREGRLFEIADHDDMAIFRQQIVDFRHWMKEQGQQNKPLIVTEYGILMPAEYGFPAKRVESFMLATFEFFRTASDPALGYPADGYRLVQRWCWYSVHDPRYPTGNLLRPEDGALTPLGHAFASYASSLE